MTTKKTTTSERLEQIAREMKKGADPRKFETELDRLLGTQMAERDIDKEQKWETAYRAREEES